MKYGSEGFLKINFLNMKSFNDEIKKRIIALMEKRF